MSTKTRAGYLAYLAWSQKIAALMVEGKSRHEHPLTIRKWRRAPGDKRPA